MRNFFRTFLSITSIVMCLISIIVLLHTYIQYPLTQENSKSIIYCIITSVICLSLNIAILYYSVHNESKNSRSK